MRSELEPEAADRGRKTQGENRAKIERKDQVEKILPSPNHTMVNKSTAKKSTAKKSTASSHHDEDISLLRNRLQTSEEKITILEQEVCQLKSVISQVQTSLRDATERGDKVGAAAPTAGATPTDCGNHLMDFAPRKEVEAQSIIPLEHRAPPSEAAEHQPLVDARNRSLGADVGKKYEPPMAAESGTKQTIILPTMAPWRLCYSFL